MSKSRHLIITFLICFFILAAGCTVRDTADVRSTPSSESLPLESLALAQSDVPPNFHLAESRYKNSSEVGKLAFDLGWQQGYVVRYTPLPGSEPDTTEIVQTVTRYPAKNIPAIAELIEHQERSDSTMTFTNLSSPGLGRYSRAFSGTTTIRITNISGNQYPGYDSVHETTRQDFIEIIFSQGDILEVIRMTGPGSDFSTLTDMANKAFDKIP
ncbi:MAG: hypothetical protein LUQ54_03080 [Methanoregula sp.]|nr:hypothetical protein [Methanoregula sp.]